MKEDLIFTGYRTFTSKSGNLCNVLDFITKPHYSEDKSTGYCSPVSIFTTPEKYNAFVSANKLLAYCSVNCEIVGKSVRYIL